MALAPTRQPYRFTVEEYLAFERASEERHEYLDGVIYAMAGESPDHGRICTNLVATLVPQLRGSDCEVFSKDTKVCCGPYRAHTREGLYAYPDLVVVCGAMQFHSQAEDVLVNPKVIVEVLSPSTEAFDRGEKFHRYSALAPDAHGLCAGGAGPTGDRPLPAHPDRGSCSAGADAVGVGDPRRPRRPPAPAAASTARCRWPRCTSASCSLRPRGI